MSMLIDSYRFSTSSDPDIVLVYDTTLSTGTQVSVYLDSPTLLTIDWGDGNTEPATVSDAYAHTYASEGEYTVRISAAVGGSLSGFWGADNATQAAKLIRVESWGALGITSMWFALYGCSNLTSVVGPPATATDLTGMFTDAVGFNVDIGSWDMSNVTVTSRMFDACAAFNQDIGSWDMSNVTEAFQMFDGCTAFNQDISGWDVSSLTDAYGMFTDCAAFNQPIGSWNTSAFAGSISEMFLGCTAFNQDISTWDVSGVNGMNSMFFNASSFNQDLSGWCVTLIPTKPSNFDTGASSWALPQPVWGTCP